MGPIGTHICQSSWPHTLHNSLIFEKYVAPYLCNIIYVSMYKHLIFITFTTRGQASSQIATSRHRENQSEVPKCDVAVDIGKKQRKRFLVPVSFLNRPSFRELLLRAGGEYGFEHPMGGLTIPCREEAFIDLTTQLHGF
ncbi:hypothetical protein EUGRSUZ_I01365 [Eucalyptus grandis]|uniref:Uncharacterized protein n=2 Tax=Eucalyptus grandis TaxID=71139 RepID=A0ACC3JFE4_EUCGR|nr:hypothetical protein EUGRSUZ_I01365 [Eucalyptus grandis]